MIRILIIFINVILMLLRLHYCLPVRVVVDEDVKKQAYKQAKLIPSCFVFLGSELTPNENLKCISFNISQGVGLDQKCIGNDGNTFINTCCISFLLYLQLDHHINKSPTNLQSRQSDQQWNEAKNKKKRRAVE